MNQRVNELQCRVEVTNEKEIFDVINDRVDHLLPPSRIGLDGQQVEEQLEVEPAQRDLADGGEPGRDAVRRVVARTFDFAAWVRAVDNSRA